ncbi:putative inner membrane domain protein, partial [Chlamydia psittaci 84-8471/1]
KNHTSTFGS